MTIEEQYEKFKETQKSVTVSGTNKNELLQLDEVTQELTLAKNISTEIICINKDKLELILNDFRNAVDKSKEFVTPLSLIITIVATLSTATFSDKLLSANVWEALFILVLVFCVVWFIKAVIEAIRGHEKTSVKYILEKICGGNK